MGALATGDVARYPSAVPLWNCWQACTCCLANNDVSVVISGFEEAGKHGNVHSASRVALVWPRLHFRVTIGIARFQLLSQRWRNIKMRCFGSSPSRRPVMLFLVGMSPLATNHRGRPLNHSKCGAQKVL